jgi:hypothetical protein
MDNVMKCTQKKTFVVGSIDEIFKLFYFYFYLIFDDTIEILKESQRKIKTRQLKLSEQIGIYEKNAKQYDKQIVKFKERLDVDKIDELDAKAIGVLAQLISEAEENAKTNYEKLSNAKIEMEQLSVQYEGTEAMSAYYNVKDRINDFFNKMNLEEQRDELIRIIKECLVFQQYLLIDTGTLLFVFDSKLKFKFKKEMLENLDKDNVYKKHFIEKVGDDKLSFMVLDTSIMDIEDNLKKKIFEEDDIQIWECKFSNVRKTTKAFNERVTKEIFERCKIEYDISNHASILFFLDTLF